jgi:hypothetical protein
MHLGEKGAQVAVGHSAMITIISSANQPLREQKTNQSHPQYSLATNVSSRAKTDLQSCGNII